MIAEILKGLNQSAQRLSRVREGLPWVKISKTINAESVATPTTFLFPARATITPPFRGWFAKPYNYYDPRNQLYFYGGQWGKLPFESITNISNPTPDAVAMAESARTDISRGGFGGSYGGYYGWGFHS